MEIILKYFKNLTARQTDQLDQLGHLYNYWNERINVISRKDIDALYERHVLHSLAIAAAFNFKKGMKVADLGAGGGFPGIPLAIFFPDVHFHLVDSIGKKLQVVNEICKTAGVHNVTTEHARFEELKNQQFDSVVSRAVAPLKDLWKWSKPFIAASKMPGTTPDLHNTARICPAGLICLKGGDLKNEISISKLQVKQIPISNFYEEFFFKEKYIVYVPR